MESDFTVTDDMGQARNAWESQARNAWEKYRLRRRVYDKFYQWELTSSGEIEAARILAELLGYSHYGVMWDLFNERDIALCEKLLGPHGKVIYKMLLARKCR